MQQELHEIISRLNIIQKSIIQGVDNRVFHFISHFS